MKLFLGAFIFFVAANVVVSDCSAGQFYPNGLERCISSSGRSNIWSVAEYACPKAVEKSQNACATWLGPANDSVSTVIYAANPSGTVPVALWGMCTDRANTSSMMLIMGDNGSISCGGTCNFTRSGNWGSPSSKSATLDVAKFIQGAGIINGMYCRHIMIDRAHSDGESMGMDFSLVCLSLGTPIPEPTIETPETLCKKWAPSGYTGATKWYGTTTVDVRIRNLSPRFGTTGNGAWTNGTIYAMPTDEVAWVECYFGGTPGTGHTEVSSINGGQRTYVASPLSSEYCYDNSVGGLKPRTYNNHYYTTNIGTVKQAVSYYQLYTKSPIWQNQWQIWGAGQVRRAGDTANGSWSFDKFTNKSDAKRNGYLTQEGQAGQTFTESGQTGAPKSVSISRSNPTASVSQSYYYTWEENPNDPKTCQISNPLYNPFVPGSSPTITVTNGYYCGYNKTLKVDHWHGPSCTNSYTKELRDAVVSYSSHSSSASVQIPYNFLTYTGVTIKSGEVYSGETVEVEKVWTLVAPRSNAVTKATYATQVPNANLRLYAYVTSDENGSGIGGNVTSDGNACNILGSKAKQCLQFKSKSGFTLNSKGSLAGSNDSWSEMGGTYNAFDAAAGDYMCFVSAVYPASSGSDTQMGTGGDGNWRYSSPACVLIAKKPTFQVWGEGMYTVGSVDAYVGAKRNIYNDYISNIGSKFKISGGESATIYFNPWVEESLMIKNGITGTLASGAATGANGNVAGAGNAGDFCKNRSPLTFSNSCSSTSVVGQSGIDASISNREELIDYWAGTSGGSVNTGSGASLNLGNPNAVGQAVTSATGVKIRYANSAGGLTLSGTVPQGTTYLIKAAGTVTISGDIRYNTGNYSTLGSIPKVLIYAQNVNIQCNVNEVDAIIVTRAGGSVNTCSNGGDINSSARSRQLKVFGVVVTDSINLGRTYGAAAWNKSKSSTPTDGIPAEIFDYDSSILMWSEYMSGAAETDTLQTVYQHELAPRY